MKNPFKALLGRATLYVLSRRVGQTAEAWTALFMFGTADEIRDAGRKLLGATERYEGQEHVAEFVRAGRVMVDEADRVVEMRGVATRFVGLSEREYLALLPAVQMRVNVLRDHRQGHERELEMWEAILARFEDKDAQYAAAARLAWWQHHGEQALRIGALVQDNGRFFGAEVGDSLWKRAADDLEDRVNAWRAAHGQKPWSADGARAQAGAETEGG